MRVLTFALLLVLLHTVLSAQSAMEADRVAVTRAKKIAVSELDDRLPKVSLEFFLKYEAAGMPVSWRIVKCGEEALAASPIPTCVEADFDRKNDGTATVVISIDNSKTSPATPGFIGATVTDMGGAPRKVRRLGDLPMELQRAAPKTPRDSPPGSNALVFGTSSASSG